MPHTDSDTYSTAFEADRRRASAFRRGSPGRLVRLRNRRRAESTSAGRLLEHPMDERTAPSLWEIRSREARFRRLLVMADLLAAGLALLLCVNVLGDDALHAGVILALPLVVVSSKLKGLYDRDELLLNKTTIDEVPKLFQLATLYTLVFTVLQRWFVEGHLGGDQVLVMWLSLLLLSAGARHAARIVARATTLEERCLFVGSPASRQRLSDKLGQGDMCCRIVGSMSLGTDFSEDEVGQSVANLHRHIDELVVHRVVVEPSEAAPQLTLDFVREAKATGVRVSILPRILEVVGSAIEVDDVDGLTLLGVRRFGLSRSSTLVKRLFDAFISALMLVVLAPVFVVVGLLIKLDSRGPVFYRAPRVGRHEEIFRMWKFRSMVSGADARRAELHDLNEAADGLFKIAEDPRITRLGGILRRLSIDELPQLINVLRGEMSLVGPRPLVADEDVKVLGLDRRRLHLTPGMTGPWQVLGSSRLPLSEMVKLDYLYVAGWSLWNDIKILLRTAAFVASRRGQ